MSGYENLTEHVDSTLIDSGDCPSDAGDWCCVRAKGHEMPHQASAGFVGAFVYAEWEDATT